MPDGDLQAPLKLGDLADMVIRRRRLALTAALAALLIVLAAPAWLVPAMHRATATLAQGKITEVAADATAEQLVATQRELLVARPVLEAAIASGALATSQAYAGSSDPIGLLARRLRTTVARNSLALEVALDDEEPGRAEAGLQAVIDAYLAQQTTGQRQRRATELGVLDRQLADAHAADAAAREAERTYRSANGIASTDPDRNHITTRMLALAERQAAADDRLAAASTLARQMTEADSGPPAERLARLMRIEAVAGDPAVAQARLDVSRQEAVEAELAASLLDRHPRLIEARERLIAARRHLDEAVTVVRQASQAGLSRAEDQRRELSETQSALHRELEDYRLALAGLHQLTATADAQQQVVAGLLARRADLAAARDLRDESLAQTAPPSSRPLPRPLAGAPLFGLALVAALCCAIVVAALMDLLDPKIRDARQAATVCGKPSLGRLPLLTQPVPPLTASGPGEPAALAEAMRSVWAGLRHALGAEGRIVVIASPASGDGRTTCAARLAAGASQAGVRTLLVDADLRSPGMEGNVGGARSPGLAELLVGAPDIAPQASGWANLDLMPAGTSPPNPGELLHSHCLGEWLGQCRQAYDLIVIDSPCLERFADAVVLGEHADGIVLMARAGRTSLAALSEARSRLSPLSARLVGVLTVCG